jgi:Putative zinc-finger
MRCEDIEEDLVSFVLGELSEDESEAISMHLASCLKCRTEVAQYRQTLFALSRWKMPAHGRPPNFAFLPAPQAAGHDPDPRKRRRRNIARAGIAAAFVALFAAAFVLGTNIRYDGGTISITVGNAKMGYTPADSATIAAIVNKAREHDMQLVSGMIAASEARQAELNRATLTTFSRQVNDRQRSYTAYIMSHMYRLQQQDQIAYYQSQAALDGIVKLASSVR